MKSTSSAACTENMGIDTAAAKVVYLVSLQIEYARVVELADSLDSGSSVHYVRAGSSPASRTIKETSFVYHGKRGFSAFRKKTIGRMNSVNPDLRRLKNVRQI